MLGLRVASSFLVAVIGSLAGQDRESNPPLHVAFVGELESARGADFVAFLRAQFGRVDAYERRDCTPDRLRTADVVVLDWPEADGVARWREHPGEPRRNPLGELRRWNVPTVLLGGAGRNVAMDWGLPGSEGSVCRQAVAYGVREHAIFVAPHRIDLAATTEVDTPEPWRAALPGQAKVAVLALADLDAGAGEGWCAAAVELEGPEIEVMAGALDGALDGAQPTHAALWRQGHLLHFGFAAAPGAMNASGRMLLLDAIAYIARFVTDRPIVRTRSPLDPAGPGPSRARLERLLGARDATAADLAGLFAEPWAAQIAALDAAAARAFVVERRGALSVGEAAQGGRFGFDALAVRRGLDLRRVASLEALVALRDDGPRAEAVASLLRLLPDGPDADTTTNNWRSWLNSNGPSLAHDPLALCFRSDPVAQWWRVPSDSVRGAARADGEAVHEARAAALAAEVVAHHGGSRAFDDLRSFACRTGAVRFFWDRAHGILRVENRTVLPPGVRATPWRLIVFDTAADVDIVKGGGPEPRPTMSGRALVRDLTERLFAPLLLLRPGTALERLADGTGGERRLAVRMAGCGLLPRATRTLLVDAAGGLLGFEETLGRSAVVTRVRATTDVGPLLLPTDYVRPGRRDREFVYEDVQWNPPVPDHLVDSKELILGGA